MCHERASKSTKKKPPAFTPYLQQIFVGDSKTFAPTLGAVCMKDHKTPPYANFYNCYVTKEIINSKLKLFCLGSLWFPADRIRRGVHLRRTK